jgi:hypothetical protein
MGISFGAENVHNISSGSPPFPSQRRFNVDAALIIVIVDFYYKMDRILSNLKCQLISLLSMKEKIKVNSALCSIFQ